MAEDQLAGQVNVKVESRLLEPCQAHRVVKDDHIRHLKEQLHESEAAKSKLKHEATRLKDDVASLTAELQQLKQHCAAVVDNDVGCSTDTGPVAGSRLWL